MKDSPDRDRDVARYDALTRWVNERRAELHHAWADGSPDSRVRKIRESIDSALQEQAILRRRWPVLRSRSRGAGVDGSTPVEASPEPTSADATNRASLAAAPASERPPSPPKPSEVDNRRGPRLAAFVDHKNRFRANKDRRKE